MGCDIHCYQEIRDPETGTWRPLWPNEFGHESDRWLRWLNGRWSKNEDEIDPENPSCIWWSGGVITNRNYWLFGVLAGVRGIEAQPIDVPRGLPHDVSDAIKKESDRWGSDGHSHSYITIREWYAYDWVANGRGEWGDIEAIDKAVDAMAAYRADLGLTNDDVRFVFWFDN